MENNITGFLHFGFNTKDLNAALDFYCRILGFRVEKQLNAPDNLPPEAPLYSLRGKPFITYITDGVQHMELFSPVPGRKERFDDGTNFGFTHLAIGVKDMGAFLQMAKAEHITIDSEPEQGKSKAAWIRDPDGNRIEVMQG